MTRRVLIDLRMVEGRLHGIARYALTLARLLPGLAPALRFEGLGPPGGLPGGLGPLAPEIRVHTSAAAFLSPLEQPRLGRELRALAPDLFFATSFSVPALWPGRLVATLHDAVHLVRAGEFSRLTALYYRGVVRPRIARAEGLLTVSGFARDELAERLRVPAARWTVVPPGVDPRFRPLAPGERAAAVRRLGLPERYLLAVGNPKPHKNLGLLARIAPDLPLPLVVLGGTAPPFGPPARLLEGVDEADLPALYAAAEAVLVPSRHEGFGLPALEAMAAGTPVVAADAGALPETVGGAGVLVGPDDAGGWVRAVEGLVTDSARRSAAVEAGLARARTLDWPRCARDTLTVLRRALGDV